MERGYREVIKCDLAGSLRYVIATLSEGIGNCWNEAVLVR
jgi:hypothetical protein